MMFTISKILTFVLLPPGSLIFALVVGILLMARKRKRASAIVLSAAAAAFFLLSFSPFADLLLRPLEDAHPPLAAVEQLNPKDYADVGLIVVLGGGSTARSPEAGSKSVLIESGLKRAEYGAALAKRLDLPLLYSAGVVYEQEGVEAESEVARRFWVSLGIEDSRILVENASRNTYENAGLTAKMAKGKKLLLVTSAFHMPRSVQSFRKRGVDFTPAPTDYHATRTSYVWANYFPSEGSFRNSYFALHEYLGMAYYSLLK